MQVTAGVLSMNLGYSLRSKVFIVSIKMMGKGSRQTFSDDSF